MATKMLAAAAALIPAVALSAQAVGDYSAAPVAPGSWSYQPVAGGSHARFVDSTGTARLVLQCARATRRVTLAATSTAPATTLSVWTTTASRVLPARFEPNGFRVAAELAANDPLLDAMVFSRGRFAVTMPGVAAVVVPAWPEAARVVEDCRN